MSLAEHGERLRQQEEAEPRFIRRWVKRRVDVALGLPRSVTNRWNENAQAAATLEMIRKDRARTSGRPTAELAREIRRRGEEMILGGEGTQAEQAAQIASREAERAAQGQAELDGVLRGSRINFKHVDAPEVHKALLRLWPRPSHPKCHKAGS